jgi:hypothetical protein
MQSITTIGLDLAKSIFQVHGIDAAGQVVMRRQLKRRYRQADIRASSTEARSNISLHRCVCLLRNARSPPAVVWGSEQCPLLGVKRTSDLSSAMSA